jgi:parvulin-like peptidyl-prolyl isomerase
MNRGIAIWTFMLMVAAMVGWLSIHEVDDSARAAASASASAGAEHGVEPVGGGSGEAIDDAADAGAGEIEDVAFDLDGGFELGDGGVPELEDAPKSITFGAVLIRYKGAQGAKPDTRSKADAKALADELLPLAKDTFDEAVKKGDKGSEADAGKMFRGILEPNIEYALFSLEPGHVSDVIDTPRGFWIAKRID